MRELIRESVQVFCLEFLADPYLCYTEHGQHALFFSRLLQRIPESARYLMWQGERVCTVQKEYPTADKLGKSQRQHWDVAVIKSPPSSKTSGAKSFDYLRLEAAIEFGMNAAFEHLQDDIERLSHPDSNTDYGFAVHFHRLSDPTSLFSGRDWSPSSTRIVEKEMIREVVNDRPVEVYLGVSDSTGEVESGLWVIDGTGKVKEIGIA